MKRKYKVREITPKEDMCLAYACPAIYEVEEITPKDSICCIGSCPSIYQEKCIGGACPDIIEHDKDYLIIGKKVNPKDFGLAKKVGDDEVLISVPKEIIDNRRK